MSRMCALPIGWMVLMLNQPAWAEQPRSERPQAPPKEKQASVDRYGDPLPAGAVARLGTLRFRHDGTANALVYSPDGKILAGNCSGKIILWEAATGKRIRQLPIGSAGWLSRRALDFSADGKVLAVAHGEPFSSAALGDRFRDEISLWDVANGNLVRSFKPPLRFLPTMLRFSPDGKSLAVGSGHELFLGEATTGKELWHKQHTNAMTHDFVFSPDGKQLALIFCTGRNEVQLWDAGTGKFLRSLEHTKNNGIGRAMAYSADGKTLASEGMDRIYLWETATGKEQGRLEARMRFSVGLAFTPDGKTLVSATDDLKVHLWDVKKQTLRLTLGRPLSGAGASLALSPDGRTLAQGTHYSQIHFWDVAGGKELFTEFQGHDSGIRCLAFSPDGGLLACGGDRRQVRCWDTKTWKPIRDLDGNAQMLSFTPDGKYLASVPFVPTNFPTHGDATRNKPVVIWELSTGKGIANVPAPGMKNIEWAAFSHGGKNLVSFDGDNLTLWAIAARRQIGQIPVRGFRSQIRPVLAPDGTSVMAVRSFGAGMRKPFPSAFFIDLDSGMKDLIFGEMPPREDPGAISLSPDGKILALGEHRKIALFDLLLDQEIQPLKRTFGNHSRGLSVLACSPDGRWLASAAGYPQHMGDLPDIPEVKLWDVRTGEEIACFHGDGGFIASLAFSPDGSRLLSGMWNGTILVWDVAAAARVLKPQAVDLSALELNALWQDLVGEDATKAYKALWALAAAPAKTVSLLKKELLPAAKASPEEIRQLIAALDSEKFSVRDRASQQLRALGSEVEVPLSQALNGNPSLEKRRRVEALLEAVMPKPSAVFRSRRGIQALEQIGTPEARQVLQSLADEMPTAVRTTEAKAALERLTRRTAAPSR